MPDQKKWTIMVYLAGDNNLDANGAAIYFPTRDVSPLYARLDFVKKTGSGRFLRAYVKATRAR